MERQKVPTDPKKAAIFLDRVNLLLMAMVISSHCTAQEAEELQLKLNEDFLTDFKTQVIEEMLESQRETNNALAAALGMRGAK